MSELTRPESTPESETPPKWQPKWDYERAKLFFDPIPEKNLCPLKERKDVPDPEKVRIGCVAPGLIVLGLYFFLFAVFNDPNAIVAALLFTLIGGVWIAIRVRSTAYQNTRAIDVAAQQNRAIDADNEEIAIENAEIDQFNRNRTVVNGRDLDRICADYLKSDVESMALSKLGIDKSQVQEIAPIVFDGYYYRELKTSKPKIKKCSRDQGERSSHYNAVIFFFSEDQVYCYQLRYSLLSDVRQESTDELFYQDIVSVATTSDTIRYDKGSTISFEEFTLTTAGGTKMEATISNTESAERSIQEMRNLLRRKKQQM